MQLESFQKEHLFWKMYEKYLLHGCSVVMMSLQFPVISEARHAKGGMT